RGHGMAESGAVGSDAEARRGSQSVAGRSACAEDFPGRDEGPLYRSVCGFAHQSRADVGARLPPSPGRDAGEPPARGQAPSRICGGPGSIRAQQRDADWGFCTAGRWKMTLVLALASMAMCAPLTPELQGAVNTLESLWLIRIHREELIALFDEDMRAGKLCM